MILSCQNISKSFNEQPVLSNVSFHIEDYDKAAVVGINGAGKTTLLRIIVGHLQADDGIVTLSKDKSLGYLAQNQDVDSENTIYDELLSVKADLISMEQKIREMEHKMKLVSGTELDALMDSYARLTHSFELSNGYAYKSEVVGVLKGLGFEEAEFSKKISTLSGGQKTRVALGRLLLLKPDLIILDEPTNHLDMEAITALNNGLIKFPGVALFACHDHQFVQTTANRIMEILPDGSLIDKITSYDEYLESDEMARKRTVYTKQAEEDDN